MSLDRPEVLLEVNNLKKYFPIRGGVFSRPMGRVHAVDGVSFKIHSDGVLGLVGESGSGKSTMGFAMLRLQACTGVVRFVVVPSPS